MNKIKEKNNAINVTQHSVAGVTLESVNFKLFSDRTVPNIFSSTLTNPFYAVKSAQKYLKRFLYSLWRKIRQKAMTKKLDPKKILKTLEGFGPSDRIYRAYSLRLHYTPGVEFMARECQAWNLIMFIKPIFETFSISQDPIAIKIQGIHKHKTKIIYHDGSSEIHKPGEEYVDMAFPLKELTLLYAGGVLMLTNEYRQIK